MSVLTALSVYLDVSGYVLATSPEMSGYSTPSAVDVATRTGEAVTTKITGAPVEILPKYMAGVDGRNYYHQKTSGDGTLIGHYAQVEDVVVLRAKRFAEVNERSRELLEAGFTHSSKTFSLSLEARVSMRETARSSDEANLSYPLKWDTIGDTDVLSMADKAAVDAFYQAAEDAVRTIEDGGTTLKTSLRAASTVVAIDAVVDNR